jgi:hypothetical protein
MKVKSYSPGAQRMNRLLHELFRGSDWRTILAAIGFLGLMHWAATDTHEFFRAYVRKLIPDRFHEEAGILSVVLLFGYISVWRRFASRAHGGKLDIRVEPVAAPCKGLIVFLSLIRNTPEGPDTDQTVDGLGRDGRLAGTQDKSLKNATVREALQGPWRVPVEAIAHHIDTLETLVVIHSMPQAQQFDAAGSLIPSPYERFAAMVEGLTAYRNKPLEIVRVHVAGADRGINFNDPHQVLDAVEKAKDVLLLERKLRPHEIVIDVTSGTKIVTGIAAAAAFDEKVRFQYVASRGRSAYSVGAYDMSYVPD